MISPNNKPKPPPKATTKWPIVVACLWIVVAAAVVLLWVVSSRQRDEGIENADKGSGLIPDVSPQVSRQATKEPATVSDVAKVDVVEEPVAKAPSKRQSDLPWANKPPRVIKMREADKKQRRFVYDSEELIADLLETEPGTLIFGELPYGKRFNDDFKQAIMQKVKINQDDDDYTKALKLQVQAVKDDFKQILINGGDVGEEMRKARNELKELGLYKETLKREIFALRKSGEYSSDDMKDFIAAANKMLEDKGLSPLNVPAVFLRNLKLKESKGK